MDPIAAPMTASMEPPVPSVSSSTCPNTSAAVILAILGDCAPAVPGVDHSDRRVQRHPRRIATYSASPSLRGARDHVGCPASRSMRWRICRKRAPRQVAFGELQGKVALHQARRRVSPRRTGRDPGAGPARPALLGRDEGAACTSQRAPRKRRRRMRHRHEQQLAASTPPSSWLPPRVGHISKVTREPKGPQTRGQAGLSARGVPRPSMALPCGAPAICNRSKASETFGVETARN